MLHGCIRGDAKHPADGRADPLSVPPTYYFFFEAGPGWQEPGISRHTRNSVKLSPKKILAITSEASCVLGIVADCRSAPVPEGNN